jgi:hypothetical protein
MVRSRPGHAAVTSAIYVHGVSVVAVRRGANGAQSHVQDCSFN